MKSILSFNESAEKNLINDPDWQPYITGNGSMPERDKNLLNLMAQFFFYKGDLDHARDVSYKSSLAWENEAERALQPYRVNALFVSALYRGLAQRTDEAKQLWQKMVEERRRTSERELFGQRMVHLWIYEAYALERLGRYDEVSEPANKGFENIKKGKGTYKAPHRNSWVYGLAEILMSLADYQVTHSIEMQRKAQHALIEYKKENLRYGRSGYDIIFDLQFAYPHIFTQILPGLDPNKD